MNILIEILIKEFSKWKYYLIALAWIMLMVFFTYTTILSEAMMVGKSLENIHWNNQCSMISLIVNCGLLFMVVFDYMLAGKDISHTMMWFIFLGIILAIGIYGHTKILVSSTLSYYKFPLNWPLLSLYLILLAFAVRRSMIASAKVGSLI